MLKRLNVYLKEMYPVIPRLILGFIVFFEVYFLVILTAGVEAVSIGYQEVIGSVTIFTFLMALRIADEFKDREVDLKLFPSRPYPSGRVKTKDLVVLLSFISVVTIALNLLFMNNRIYFLVLALYGLAMSVWFFSKQKIQKSLPLALLTHNPIQLVINLYMISFACIKYDLPILSFNNLLILFTLYFPGLIWELSRKTWAPKDETEYTTYSKLFGHRKVTIVIIAVMAIDMVTSSILMYQLVPVATVSVILSYIWFVFQGKRFIQDPNRFKLVDKVVIYEYVTEATMVLVELFYIWNRWIK
jgi:4-hydroxybenzoate polyprenyltransferase